MNSREPNEWICHAAQCLNLGRTTPAFPYKGYTEIHTLEDARAVVSSQHATDSFQSHLGTSCTDSVAQLLLALKGFPLFHTTHLWLELRHPDNDTNFPWANACAISCIIILPTTNPRTENTARAITEEVVCALREHARRTNRDVQGSLIWAAPVLMNFNDTRAQGFGVQLTLEAHANGTS